MMGLQPFAMLRRQGHLARSSANPAVAAGSRQIFIHKSNRLVRTMAQAFQAPAFSTPCPILFIQQGNFSVNLHVLY
jgi:hypothetical protein